MRIFFFFAIQAILQTLSVQPEKLPRNSKYLTILTVLKELQRIDPDTICARIMLDPTLAVGEGYEALHRKVSKWGVKLQAATHVPEWFHWLHVAYHPKLPAVETILAMAPQDYPLSAETVGRVSVMWAEFCVVQEDRPCSYVSKSLTHGKIQDGFKMTHWHFNAYLDFEIQQETLRIRNR